MLKNQKKIWITGASSGIGKAVAEKFAKEGWQVAVSARRKEILDQMAKDRNISSFPLDVVDEENCKITFQKIITTWSLLKGQYMYLCMNWQVIKGLDKSNVQKNRFSLVSNGIGKKIWLFNDNFVLLIG